MMRKLFLAAFGFLALSVPVMSFAQESTISSDISINKQGLPDTVTITFYVVNSGGNIKDIKEKNDKTVNNVISLIKARLKEGESIRTIAYRINNIYSYKDKVRIFQKYEVSNGFEVKLKDLDKISEIIDLATKNDVKNVQTIVFSLEDANNTCNSLMAQALKLAQSRAQYIAKSGGLELLKPKSISPYCSVSSNSTTPRMYANASFKAEGTSYDTANVVESIEPGVLDARANVNMVYYLK